MAAAHVNYNRNDVSDVRVRVKPDATGHFVIHHLQPGRWVISNCSKFPKVIVEAGRTDVEVP